MTRDFSTPEGNISNIDRFITDPEHLATSNYVDPELVEETVNKPWTVVICYDHETRQYESMIPELGIGTIADSRVEALSGMEDCLVTYVEGVLETGGEIIEPPVKSIEEFLPRIPTRLQKLMGVLATGGYSLLERGKN